MVAAAVRTVFANPMLSTGDASWTRSPPCGGTVPRRGCLGDAAEDLLAFTTFPQAHWRKGVVNEPAGAPQRRDQATHQRGGFFPNDASIARLVTAVVVEAHDEWAVAERRYLSAQSMNKLAVSRSGAGTRTQNPLINSQMLCQLSYPGRI